jgi:hypothetical protein
MYEKNNHKNFPVDFSEPLKAIRESICTIMQTMDYINTRPQKAGMHAQPMFEDIHCLLASLNHVLKQSSIHAKSPEEINDVNKTRDMVTHAYMELKQII